MRRRALLASTGTGVFALAGCAAVTGLEERNGLPEGCPTTQGLGVEWLEDLDASTVGSFVEGYEIEYYRTFEADFQLDSQLDEVELLGRVVEPPAEIGDGWQLGFEGLVGMKLTALSLDATTADPPQYVDLVPDRDIDDEQLAELVETAAETGAADFGVAGDDVDPYLDRLVSLSDDFDPFSHYEERDTLYVEVDGTPVAVTVEAVPVNSDTWWYAWYYVDENVVRRTNEADVDPRDGTLLGCRESG